MGFNFRSIPFVARARPSGGGGPVFSAAYVSNAVDGDTFETTKTFNAVNIGAADASRKLYVFLATHCIETSVIQMSVNGGAGVTSLASVRPTGSQNRRQLLLFEADVPTGTTANFVFSNDVNEFQGTAMGVIRVVGAHTRAFATADDTDFNGSIPISLTTLAGDTVFNAVCSIDAAPTIYTPPSGFTEHFEVDPAGFGNRSFTLNSGTAAGGSPETFTTASSATNQYSVIGLRVRAS